MTTIDYAVLRGIATEAGLDEGGIRTDYSGRGMFGKACVGFDLDGKGQLLSLGAAILTEGGEDLLDTFVTRASFDAMGMGLVVYFPGLTCLDGPDFDPDYDADED